MAQVGKISMIKKDATPGIVSLTNSLRNHGYQRFPGTTRTVYPYKENNGLYRTGLDENASYISRISDKALQDSERKRVQSLREKLEKELNISLTPDAEFYKFNTKQTLKVGPYMLTDKDAVFDLDDPFQAVTFAWLRVHPIIAPSLEAYLTGQVSPDTQYYVNDVDTEAKINYDRKKTLNTAIIQLDGLSIDKRKKIARLMDLPYTDDTKEEVVYNGIDNLLRLNEMPSGARKGILPVTVFNDLLSLNSDLLDVKDLVQQSFKQNIYRLQKGGKVYEGELLVFESESDLVDHMVDPANATDRIKLEKKISINKMKV